MPISDVPERAEFSLIAAHLLSPRETVRRAPQRDVQPAVPVVSDAAPAIPADDPLRALLAPDVPGTTAPGADVTRRFAQPEELARPPRFREEESRVEEPRLGEGRAFEQRPVEQRAGAAVPAPAPERAPQGLPPTPEPQLPEPAPSAADVPPARATDVDFEQPVPEAATTPVAPSPLAEFAPSVDELTRDQVREEMLRPLIIPTLLWTLEGQIYRFLGDPSVLQAIGRIQALRPLNEGETPGSQVPLRSERTGPIPVTRGGAPAEFERSTASAEPNGLDVDAVA